MYPEGFRYTKDHEWVNVDRKLDDSVATVGITEYAQEQLGDVDFAELPKVGVKMNAGQSFGTVESVKAVSEIFMPVSGEIAEINSTLVDTPESINKDPHGSAWLVKIKMSDPAEVSRLMDAKAYESYVATQAAEH
jgi:glycine cleavage system H protein